MKKIIRPEGLRRNSKYARFRGPLGKREQPLPPAPNLKVMAVIPAATRFDKGSLEGVTLLGIATPPARGQKVRLVRNSDPRPRVIYTATVYDENPTRIVLEHVSKTEECQ